MELELAKLVVLGVPFCRSVNRQSSGFPTLDNRADQIIATYRAFRWTADLISDWTSHAWYHKTAFSEICPTATVFLHQIAPAELVVRSPNKNEFKNYHAYVYYVVYHCVVYYYVRMHAKYIGSSRAVGEKYRLKKSRISHPAHGWRNAYSGYPHILMTLAEVQEFELRIMVFPN